ncbi:MAG: NUDIX hydrolase [Chloroflexota bacterium]|nr:NUDIX hydrolase [Chloroflexota bacterium]
MSASPAPIYRDPKVAVAVIIADQRGILLQQRAIDPRRHLWTFPSGYVDRGEQIERAAEREIREELGVCVTLTHLLGVYSEPENPVVLIVYIGAVPTSAAPIIQEEEIAAIGYFAPNDLPPLAFDHDAQIIADWQAFIADGQEVLPR